MLTEPLFFVGSAVVLVGVASALIRGLRGPAQALVLAGGAAFVIGGALLIGIARDRHRFRVVAVEVRADAREAGRCPGERSVWARVTTAGGPGDVVLEVLSGSEVATGRAATTRQTVPVRGAASFELHTRVPVPRAGVTETYVVVEQPNHRVGSTSYSVTCSAA